ncbi:MAG: hypothetical protein ACLUGJ_11705 [Blautia wexlerae]
MKPTIEILTRLQENSKTIMMKCLQSSFGICSVQTFIISAFQNLYANNGAGTKGVDERYSRRIQ